MSYASVADVEVRLGRPLAAAEHDLTVVLLQDAETLIRAKLPDWTNASRTAVSAVSSW